MTRRCSHCSNNGHNSRTCTLRSSGSGGGVCAGGGGGGAGCGGGGGGGGGGGAAVGVVKLFGVRLNDNSIIKKSASMGNLSHYYSSSSAAASPNPSSPSADPLLDPDNVRDGYVSDDPAHAACSANRRSERKKGIPWTEEEHRMFLIGLQKLGKGDWRGIARNYVVSRTPTQVASHAQKYFIRQSNASRRKRRSSLFDMASDHQSMPEEQSLPPASEMVGENNEAHPAPSLDLSPTSELEPMDITSHERVEEEELAVPSNEPLTAVPAFFPAYIPVPIQLWPVLNEEGKGGGASSHEVLKPIPVLPKEPVNVDELVGLHQLSLGEIEHGHVEPSPLSLKLMGSSRPSAFHANTGVSGSNVNGNKSNAIQAA